MTDHGEAVLLTPRDLAGGWWRIHRRLSRCRDELTNPAKLVLFNFLQRLSEDSIDVWPTQQTIAIDVGLSDRAVRTAIGELESVGYVSGRRRGPGIPKLYTLHLGALLKWANSPLPETVDSLSTKTGTEFHLSRNSLPKEEDPDQEDPNEGSGAFGAANSAYALNDEITDHEASLRSAKTTPTQPHLLSEPETTLTTNGGEASTAPRPNPGSKKVPPAAAAATTKAATQSAILRSKLTADAIEQLCVEFEGRLPDPRASIDACRGHRGILGALDQVSYARRWMERDVERQTQPLAPWQVRNGMAPGDRFTVPGADESPQALRGTGRLTEV